MARYANQPISELRQLDLRELELFFTITREMVKAENGKGRDSDDDDGKKLTLG